MPCSLLCPPRLVQCLAQRRHFAKTGWRLLIRGAETVEELAGFEVGLEAMVSLPVL